ncbi:hypothetical protein HII17_14405 [Thalassotalea sp. M1531]|uniref:Sel1 repeat family protein n=1 Tax=Thalassotalea algicola TaxID=2716224 RepID=A0A7Y0Q776_9GAMM|nr:hypothetical protein [Thalassotalea algicola]NMP32749.1 hypothetical protein [Thalassotalea algicola]
MLVRALILLSLMITLSSSSFLFSGYFQSQIKTNQVSEATLAYALAYQLPAAELYQFEQSERGSLAWLAIAHRLVEQGNHDVSFSLGEYYLTSGKKELGIELLKQAAKSKHLLATQYLANYYYENGQYKEANFLIDDVLIAKSQPLAILKIKSLMAIGELSELNRFVPKLNHHEKSRKFLELLDKYNVLQTSPQNTKITSCPLSITLVAGTFEGLQHFETLAKQYKQGVLNDYLCIERIRYLPSYSESCSRTSNANQPISCDESFWQQYASEIKSTYLGVMLPKGGANVNYGILYIDRYDDINVFNHEVTHLLGFVDEYELSSQHKVCNEEAFDIGYNIAVIEQHLTEQHEYSYSVPISKVKQLPWFHMLDASLVLGKQQLVLNQAYAKSGVGIFLAETCQQNTKHMAIKPLNKRTLLRNHDVKLPTEYIEMLEAVPKMYSMPSFHFNISLEYLRLNDLDNANYWLNKTQMHYSAEKIEKILTRGY